MTDNRVTAAIQAADEVAIRRPSFWALADDLQAYTETASMVEAQLAEAKGEDRPLLIAEQAEIQQRIEQLGVELVGKVDSLAGVLRRIPRDIADYKAERDRFAAKANAAERGLKWLKEYVARTMREHGWKHLKTERNTIALRGNGGVQPLEITDAAAVPKQYLVATVTMALEDWNLVACCLLAADLAVPEHRITQEPSNALLREALKSDEVPGARLLPRGEHIECR